MAQIRRSCVSKQHAKMRSDLSVDIIANGFRKDVGCAKTQISVRLRRKITLLVNTLFLHVQLLPIRWDSSFRTFVGTMGAVERTSVYRWYIFVDSGLEERFGWANCCSLWWRLENVLVACASTIKMSPQYWTREVVGALFFRQPPVCIHIYRRIYMIIWLCTYMYLYASIYLVHSVLRIFTIPCALGPPHIHQRSWPSICKCVCRVKQRTS